MTLCESCRSITFHKLISRLQRPGWNHEDTIFVHLKRGRDLSESARDCPLCALIAEVLSSALSSQRSNPPAADVQQVLPQHLEARQLTEGPLHFVALIDPLGYAFPLSTNRGVELEDLLSLESHNGQKVFMAVSRVLYVSLRKVVLER